MRFSGAKWGSLSGLRRPDLELQDVSFLHATAQGEILVRTGKGGPYRVPGRKARLNARCMRFDGLALVRRREGRATPRRGVEIDLPSGRLRDEGSRSGSGRRPSMTG